jgi:hypothetical protein
VYSAAELILHFDIHPTDSWLTKLTPFPPADQLLAALGDAGREQALEAFNHLLPVSLDGMLQGDCSVDADWDELGYAGNGGCGAAEQSSREADEDLDEGHDHQSDGEREGQLNNDLDENE